MNTYYATNTRPASPDFLSTNHQNYCMPVNTNSNGSIVQDFNQQSHLNGNNGVYLADRFKQTNTFQNDTVRII